MPFELVAWLIVQNPAGQVLLGQRSRACAYGPGLWGLPGGRVERGEALAAAAARETLEETGLHVTPGHLRSLGVCRYDLDGAAGADYFFLARQWTGEPRPLDKTAAVAWCSPQALPPDALPWLPAVLNAHLLGGVRLSEQLDGWPGLRALP